MEEEAVAVGGGFLQQALRVPDLDEIQRIRFEARIDFIREFMTEEQLKQRLDDLESEFNDGQKMLAELDSRRDNLTQTLIRISGAIQVLREEMEKFKNISDENITSSIDEMENHADVKIGTV